MENRSKEHQLQITFDSQLKSAHNLREPARNQGYWCGMLSHFFFIFFLLRIDIIFGLLVANDGLVVT